MPRPAADATPRAPRSISLAVAASTWVIGWLTGNLAGSLVVVASGSADLDANARPLWVTPVSAVALWVPQLIALAVVARRFASGWWPTDFGLRFRPIDLVGIPVGVLSQLVLLQLIYWPLRGIWPDTFADKELERNARELWDRVDGVWVIVIVAMVALAAPIVEELVYRGLLLGAARRRVHDLAAWVAVAAFFALIHFRWVEFPGLFAFGLVLGGCVLLTDRIGMAVLAHMAFNATGLALVAG